MKRGGRRSKEKGSRFERECVEAAAALGLQAVRAWGSNGRSLGCHEEVDVLLAGLKCQCKRRAAIPAWLGLTPEVDVAILRADNAPAFALLPYSLLLRLLSEKEVRPCP